MGFGNWLLYGEWEKREETPSSDDSPIVIPSRASTPSFVSEREASHTLNVFRAVQIITTSMVQLSLDAYRGKELLEPAPSFITKPDVNSTFRAFIEETTTCLALNGNAYWRIRRDSSGRIQNLEILNPLDVTPTTNSFGRVTGYQWSHAEKPLAVSDVKHLKLLRISSMAKGLGPIQAAQQELRGAIDLRDYAANWFHETGIPVGTLKTDMELSPEAAKAAQKAWEETPAGKIRVLGNGLTFMSTYLDPANAQFIENRQFSTTEIARLFGIPASIFLAAVEGNSMTYSNIAQQDAVFARYTLSVYTSEIEEAFSDLLPRGTRARFNLEALLRPDVVTRYDMHSKADWLTDNEIRAIEGLSPIPGGDVLRAKKAPTTPPEENKK